MTVSHITSASTRRRILGVGLAVGVALALAGCGKKGPLEPAPGAPEAPKAAQQAANPAEPGIASLRGGGKKRPPPIQPPKSDFVLDFLL